MTRGETWCASQKLVRREDGPSSLLACQSAKEGQGANAQHLVIELNMFLVVTCRKAKEPCLHMATSKQNVPQEQCRRSRDTL